jgi:hypothetical protein
MPRKSNLSQLLSQKKPQYKITPIHNQKPKTHIIYKSKKLMTKWTEDLKYPFNSIPINNLYILSQIATIKSEIERCEKVYFKDNGIFLTPQANQMLYTIYTMCEYPYMYPPSFYWFIAKVQMVLLNISKNSSLVSMGINYDYDSNTCIIESKFLWEIFKHMYYYPSLSYINK